MRAPFCVGGLMGLEDRVAIQDLIADYAYFWDAKDAERWARLFTPDGVFELYVPGIRPPVRRLTNLGERTTAARKAFALMGPQRTRLLNTSSRFEELTEDHALVRTISLVVELVESVGGGGVLPTYTGVYLDEFRKTPVGWRFAKREVHGDQNPGFGSAQNLDPFADAASD